MNQMSKIIFSFLLCAFCAFAKAQTAGVIGKPIKIGKLLVARYDFPDLLDYVTAEKKCSALGKGWRLPTRAEIKVLYGNRNVIGFFSGGYYWTSEIYANGYNGDGYRSCWVYVFESNQETHLGMNASICVRAVKSVN